MRAARWWKDRLKDWRQGALDHWWIRALRAAVVIVFVSFLLASTVVLVVESIKEREAEAGGPAPAARVEVIERRIREIERRLASAERSIREGKEAGRSESPGDLDCEPWQVYVRDEAGRWRCDVLIWR